MKKLVIAVCFACMSVMQAKAEMFTYYLDDAPAAFDAVRDGKSVTCSDGGKQIVACRCGTAQTPRPASGQAEEYCWIGSTMSSFGCRFQGDAAENVAAYCLDTGANNACVLCGCKNVSSDSDWKSIGSNRVSRTVQTANASDDYECVVTSTTEYGCAANYYQSAGSGASMTCTACPQSGTNAIGTTAITTCTLAKTTKMTDTSGTYECSVDYKYTK